MDNKTKQQVRTGIAVGVLLTFIVAFITYSGIQLPFFNSYNPLYSPYVWLFMGVILYAFRSRIREVKSIWNTLFFFNSAGLGDVHDLKAEDVKPIYLFYNRADGTKGEIKHSHPMVIPSEESFEQIYMVPKSGLEALNPKRLIEKYGPKLPKDQVYFLMTLKIPEIQALNPEFLVQDMTETEDADTIFQEFKEHVASINTWSRAKSTLKENWFMFVMVGVAGFAVAKTIFMISGADFRGVVTH